MHTHSCRQVNTFGWNYSVLQNWQIYSWGTSVWWSSSAMMDNCRQSEARNRLFLLIQTIHMADGFLGVLFRSQRHGQRVASVNDWSPYMEGNTLVSVVCVRRVYWWLWRAFRCPLRFVFFDSTAASSFWMTSTAWKAHKQGIPASAITLRLTSPESRRTEDGPSVGRSVTEPTWTGKLKENTNLCLECSAAWSCTVGYEPN